MSSLFNYELDENNIRSTLLKAEPSQFNETDWDEFDNNYNKFQHKTASSGVFKLPEIRLNINRNIILPAFFVLALIGVSAVLLSFIDFKKDKEQVEKKLIPEAENFKPAVTTQHQTKPIVQTAKKEEIKPAIVPPTSTITETISNIVSQEIVSNNDPAKSQIVSNHTSNSTVSLQPSTNINPTISNPVTAVNTNSVPAYPQKIRRKRVEKVPPEQIENMKAPALIKSESENSEPEPDLEIKLD